MQRVPRLVKEFNVVNYPNIYFDGRVRPLQIEGGHYVWETTGILALSGYKNQFPRNVMDIMLSSRSTFCYPQLAEAYWLLKFPYNINPKTEYANYQSNLRRSLKAVKNSKLRILAHDFRDDWKKSLSQFDSKFADRIIYDMQHGLKEEQAIMAFLAKMEDGTVITFSPRVAESIKDYGIEVKLLRNGAMPKPINLDWSAMMVQDKVHESLDDKKSQYEYII